MSRRKLFCEHGKICYMISLKKEYLIRDIKDITARLTGERFAAYISEQTLPVIVKGHFSAVARRLEGVDMQLQENKAENLRIAAELIDGLIIRQGETFSFWKLVGQPTAEKGYLEGLVISGNRLGSGTGGGLCQLANLIHWLVLNSPLKVTELHHHSDALFPDDRRRVPFGTGTSVFYKNVDYRFKNTTDRDVQLKVWLDNDTLFGELRAGKPFPERYRITEEGHCFVREEDGFYRCSRIYRECISRESGKLISRELILKNHSRVMYDESLIPREEISDVVL